MPRASMSGARGEVRESFIQDTDTVEPLGLPSFTVRALRVRAACLLSLAVLAVPVAMSSCASCPDPNWTAQTLWSAVLLAARHSTALSSSTHTTLTRVSWPAHASKP